MTEQEEKELRDAAALVKDALPQIELVAKQLREILTENADIKEKFRTLQNRVNNVLLLGDTVKELKEVVDGLVKKQGKKKK
jgi:hypothetical protein